MGWLNVEASLVVWVYVELGSFPATICLYTTNFRRPWSYCPPQFMDGGGSSVGIRLHIYAQSYGPGQNTFVVVLRWIVIRNIPFAREEFNTEQIGTRGSA